MKPTFGQEPELVVSRTHRRLQRQKQRWRRARNVFFGTVVTLLALVGVLVVVGFATPFGRQARLTLAETIISTRHYTWARYVTTKAEYFQLLRQLSNSRVVNTGIPSDVHIRGFTSTGPIEVSQISQDGWNGWLMLVHDPRLIRLVKANVHNGEGEYITSMAPRVGAIAGINASGFEDPNGGGWGGIPVGLEYVGGQLVNPMKTNENWTTVGFTRDGYMVMGNYTLRQLQALGVRDAMQFHPELVVNGKPMITQGDGGMGYDPRTAIGQTRDGTVIFVVINGRLRNGSLGATQRQVMDLMLKLGAVNACAMDGGSSSVMYDAYAKHKILNSPSTIDPNGERHLPDAWLVFPNEQAADRYGL